MAPTRVVAVTGNVTGAQSLVGAGGDGDATLVRTSGSPAPSITFDFGQDVGGVPYFDVASVSGTPTLRAAYSEGLQYLGPKGDEYGSESATGDPARADDLIVAYPGELTTGMIQGAQRYERISLTSPGTLTLSAIGFRFTAVRATPGAYRGWFASSSPTLNRIWYDGAYTTQLDELPPSSASPPWRIAGHALEAVEGGAGLLAEGTDWSNYTMTFATRVVDQGAGWLVRASNSPGTSSVSGYFFFLSAGTGKPGSRGALVMIALGPNEFSVIKRVTLESSFNAAYWHDVTTVVDGSDIATSIDGKPVMAVNTALLPSGASVYTTGTIGFLEYSSTAMFKDLDLTRPDGVQLYANNLSQASALADFPGTDTNRSDVRPAIMDGAKRDRVVWSGDLGTEAPTVFYSIDNANYVRASLKLLGSYQVADGASGTNIDPTAPLGTFPEDITPYSAAYSMDEVNNIATYFLYTGDLGFVWSEWPMITRELAYDASLVDSRGLLVTDSRDGQDWDYYDGSRSGEVCSYNDIYFETLSNASMMATSLGLTNQAAQYREEASQLRTAINRYLFDPARELYELSNRKPSAVAQDANSLAVLYGVAPPRSRGSIVEAMERSLPVTPYGPEAFSPNAGYRAQVSPYVTSEEVAALFATNHEAAGLSLIRTLWGHMDAPGPDDTRADWELVGANGSPGFGRETSLAHGWASGATADLSRFVLGVVPTAPGFKVWSVQPHLGHLSWVEGDVPTPAGTIEVRSAQLAPSGRLALAVKAPPGTRGTISVPVPPSGAYVVVQTSPRSPSSPRRTITASQGTHDVMVNAVGGFRYHITVTPT